MAEEKLVRMPCQKCGKKIGVRPDQFGRRLRCPACQTAFRLDPPSAAVAKPVPAPHSTAPPPEPEEDVFVDEAGELVATGSPWRATATVRFYQPPGVVFEATAFAIRRAGGEVRSLDRANLHVRFTAGANTNATEHTVYVFPGPTGGSELDIRATSAGGQADEILYRHIAVELAEYLEAHHAHLLATTRIIASDEHHYPQRKAVFITSVGLVLTIAFAVSIWVIQSRSPSEKSNSSGDRPPYEESKKPQPVKPQPKLNVDSFKEFAILAKQIGTGLTEGISFNDLNPKENKLRDAFAIIDKPDLESPVGQKARKALDATKSLRATWFEKIYRNGLESALDREITAAGNALSEFLIEYEAIKSR